MLKVAIVGCGQIATEKYLPIFQRLKQKVTIKSICDLNEDVLAKVSSRFGTLETYKEPSQMFLKEELDLVVICTPPSTHKNLTVEAIEKGSHVLVEKPMALSVIDCEKMIEASVRCNRKLGVMHNQIFNPAFEKAYNLVSKGKIGDFLGMRVFLMTSLHDMTTNSNHWAHKLPGGVIGETGPHAVYLSLAFLKNVTGVQVRFKKHLPEYPWSIGEDIRFDLIADNGFSSITLIYGSNQTAAEVDIIGTKGRLKVDLQSRIMISHNRVQNYPGVSPKAVAKSMISNIYQTAKSFAINGVQYVASKNLDGHYTGINRFLDFLEDKSDFKATGEKGREVTAAMEMIVQKMQEVKGQRSEVLAQKQIL